MTISSNNISKIFKTHYYNAIKISKKSLLSNNPEFELLPAMFIVCDFATANAKKDRRKVADLIFTEIDTINSDYDRIKFDKRCDLYGTIIRGGKLRCEWFMGDNSIFYTNPVTKCVALYSDIIFNEDCADNYDKSPYMIHNIFETINFFNNVVEPLLKEFIELHNDIYNL